jgi:hypothetical protein
MVPKPVVTLRPVRLALASVSTSVVHAASLYSPAKLVPTLTLRYRHAHPQLPTYETCTSKQPVANVAAPGSVYAVALGTGRRSTKR